MKKKQFCFFIILSISFHALGQTNISLSNPAAQQILLGNFNPAYYSPAIIINDHDSILHGIVRGVSKDTLISYLEKIDSYHNRNTGSDTMSEIRGIGAVRRWIYKKYGEFSARCENRLVTSYLDFDVSVCGQNHHRDVISLLPGLDTSNKEIMLVEAHFDSRCEVLCDTACYAPGMEDNGSGTVMVMELARLLSSYAFDHTIVFANVTGEEQGLYGSKALSAFLKNNNIAIRSAFNGDMQGGIICGQTSSPPGCSGFGTIDSTHVRVFSYSLSNDSSKVSAHKQLARYIRLHQDERINPLLATPMTVDLMIYEDRIGRSGDHVPFRQKGYTCVRITSRNEFGDGSGTAPDHQHTTNDVLGLDLSVPPDGIIDSFFVDPNYLRRNIIMNGVNLGWLAIAPPSPLPQYIYSGDTLRISMHNADTVYKHYRVGLRSLHSGSLNFDTVLTFTNATSFNITWLNPHKSWFVSVANVKNNVESLFSNEFSTGYAAIESYSMNDWGVTLKQNRPNPFTDKTEIVIEASDNVNIKNAEVIIADITGRMIKSKSIELNPGINQVTINNEGLANGMYIYSLCVSGKIIGVGRMSVSR